jgi:hypothetical protein
MLAECVGGDDAEVPLGEDTLEGAKAFVKLCKIGVGEDAIELKSITPRLLADALPFVHKDALRAALRAARRPPRYPAVGLGKFAREWFGHIIGTTSTSNLPLENKDGTKILDDLSECFAILDNLFETEWTPFEIQWITGNLLGNRFVGNSLQPHGDYKVLESLTQRTLTKMMIQMNRHCPSKDETCVGFRDGARRFSSAGSAGNIIE